MRTNVEYGSLKSPHRIDEKCSLFEDLDGNPVAACFCKTNNCNRPATMMAIVEKAQMNYRCICNTVGYWKPFTTRNREKDAGLMGCLSSALRAPFNIHTYERKTTSVWSMLTMAIVIASAGIFLLSAIALACCCIIGSKPKNDD
ncbi:hypothetical protein RB195_015783 [Necator americanus]